MSLRLALPVAARAQDFTAPAASSHRVFELRQYTLHPRRRDELIDLFERHFIESQEAVGMQVPAHFRDLDAPDRFVWFRGFADMDARGQALPAFYLHGAAWQAHREQANPTMLDSDNVLLLREAWPGSGFAAERSPRPPVGATRRSSTVFMVSTYALVNPADAAFIEFFRNTLALRARAAGARLHASFVSEESGNNFPRLPVRREHVLVWVASFADEAEHARYQAAIAADAQWQAQVAPVLAQRLIWPADVRRLRPAARSWLQD